MSSTLAEFEEVVAGALRLSTLEKVQLVERVMEKLGEELAHAEPNGRLGSWVGMWEDLGSAPSGEIIDEDRRQAWSERLANDL